MNIQLVLVILVVLAAVAFMARKIALTLKRRGQCSSCGNAGSPCCGQSRESGITEIKPK